MSRKIAVVLFNLGGPDSPNAIRPFLMNFFMDRNIIALPVVFRYVLASFISRRRSKKEAGQSYGALGGASPLLENSRVQARALEDALAVAGDAEYRVFICMRYWHPMAAQVVREIRDWGADQAVLLPLYPQFSTTTTWSSLGVWKQALSEAGMDLPASMICCYPHNEAFVKAGADHIRVQYDRALEDGHDTPRVLFSAHGLPEKIVRGGDPYQWQCEETAARIVEALGIGGLDWDVCYQSRVGPMKWIGPSLDEALEKAATDGKAVIIYPHAFTQEHVETLVELDLEYKSHADRLGIPGYYRAQTVGAHPGFIEGLAGLVRIHADRHGICSEEFERICPQRFGRCCMQAQAVL